MESALVTSLLSQVNISILPVILLPVTGLSCLLFYNRLGGLVSSIQTFEREIRAQLGNNASEEQFKKEEHTAVYETYKILLKRSHLIRCAIKFCFIALFLFAVTAITVIATLYWDDVVFVTLGLWVVGALSYLMALVFGFKEIQMRSIYLEHNFIEKWHSPL